MRRKILVTAILSCVFLGACGVKGSLKTPPPLWGEKAKQDYEQKQKQDAPAKDQQDSGQNQGQDSSSPNN